MIESGTGSILFISSGLGFEPGSLKAYAVAKAAFISYYKNLSAQLAPKNS
jgi:short-subunit dehydrogenase